MSTTITYNDTLPAIADIISLYESAGLNRPTGDVARITQMYANSNLVLSAWDGGQLVGIARSLTDFCYSTYLADLAVRWSYQKKGIGKKLIDLTREKIGDKSMLLLCSAASAMEYYPKIGMDTVDNAFIFKRKS